MKKKAKHCWCEHSMNDEPAKKSEKACGHDYMDCDKMHNHHEMNHYEMHHHEMHNHKMHNHEMQGEAMPAKMPETIMLAHAYVPWQVYETAFCPAEALMKGTLFPELWGAYPIPR